MIGSSTGFLNPRLVFIVQAVILMICIVGYIVLTTINHDGNALLALAGGQALGGTLQSQAKQPSTPADPGIG